MAVPKPLEGRAEMVDPEVNRVKLKTLLSELYGEQPNALEGRAQMENPEVNRKRLEETIGSQPSTPVGGGAVGVRSGPAAPGPAPTTVGEAGILGGLGGGHIAGLMGQANQRAAGLRGTRVPEDASDLHRQLAGTDRDVFAPEAIEMARAPEFKLPHPKLGFRDIMILQALWDDLLSQRGIRTDDSV